MAKSGSSQSVKRQSNCRKFERTDENFSYSDSSYLARAVGAFVSKLYRQNQTPVVALLHKAICRKDWLATTDLRINPSDYDDPEAFARDYLAYGLLRKSESLPLGVDRIASAMEKWHEAEETCRWVNRNSGCDPFEPNSQDGYPLTATLEATIWLAREKIRRLLGRFSWDEAHASFGFSGGASTRLKRRSGHPYYKFSGKPDVTRNAALLGICAIWSIPLWRRSMQEAYGDDPVNWVNVVEGSKITTVRKTAKTDRVIAIEPDMNMFMQRGIGKMIRRRLKRVRIDLNDQSENQRLALIGSRTGSLATIDLQSASDSISLELVRLLIPDDWFEALNLLRCEVCTLPNGVKHRFEKVSSMGNGFTFELESLIFWGLTAASVQLMDVTDKRIGIYGDDIVVHNAAAEHLIRVLTRCGFRTNTEKTFVSGPFRESCGKHYFLGADVTPFYVKKQTDDIASLYWFANSLREWAGRRKSEDLQQPYSYAVELCRQKASGRLCFIPEALGKTAGLICNLDELSPIWSREAQGWVTHRLIPVRNRHEPNGTPALLAWLSLDLEDRTTRMVVEQGDTRYVRRSITLSWWCTTSNSVVLPHNVTELSFSH